MGIRFSLMRKEMRISNSTRYLDGAWFVTLHLPCEAPAI